MARTRSLASLRADVRQRADIENSTHVTDAEINRYINQGIAALHALIVEMDEDEYALETTFTVTAGETSSLITDGAPSPTTRDVYKVLAVDVIGTDGTRWAVPRFSLSDRPALETSANEGYPFGTKYRLRDLARIVWAPPFESDTTVRVTYVSGPKDLTSDGETYDGRVGWEEWIVWDAAIKCAVKEETDDSQMVRERALAEARIRQQIAIRDRANPQRIRDVTRVDRW